MVYAYLQLGQDAKAQQVVAESTSLVVNPAIFIGPYALAAMPARYAVERGEWSEAAALSVRETKFLFSDAITHFARGLGFVHINDAAAAAREAKWVEISDAGEAAFRKDAGANS